MPQTGKYKSSNEGVGVARSVQGLNLDFGPVHELGVLGFEPRVGLWAQLGVCLIRLSLSPSPHLHACSLK